MSARVPDRGDVIWMDMHPQAGHEQRGRRLAVVISPSAYNGKAGLALLCPITSQIKGYPFEVLVPPGSAVKGAILADQVKSLDWRARDARFLCRLPTATLEEVLAKLGVLLERPPVSS